MDVYIYPPHHYTTARPDEIKDPMAPGSGGNGIWGGREHQDEEY
jgi:hypothetical protein